MLRWEEGGQKIVHRNGFILKFNFFKKFYIVTKLHTQGCWQGIVTGYYKYACTTLSNVSSVIGSNVFLLRKFYLILYFSKMYSILGYITLHGCISCMSGVSEWIFFSQTFLFLLLLAKKHKNTQIHNNNKKHILYSGVHIPLCIEIYTRRELT